MKISGVQEAKIYPRASTKFGEQGITQRRRRERRFEVDIVSEAERHGFGVQ